MADTIRVLLADDHPLVRSGIRATLAGEKDVELIGEATDGLEARDMCTKMTPDVLLLDLSMPGPSPLETIKNVQQTCPDTRIIILTAYDDNVYIRSVMSAGISGYLLKDEATEALVHAIRSVVQGGTWFSRAIADKMFQRQTDPTRTDLESLTARERNILDLLGKGWDNRRIAGELHLAEQTVRNYVSRIYDKLNLHSRAEAIIWIREQGLDEQ